ncbi:MAG: protein phosphatase 2C domain-containing protein [Ferruginibacter sp.]
MDLAQIYFLFEIGGKTNQEDFIWPPAGSGSLHDNVFIVCDGVGGSENGEIASRIISESVGQAILNMQKREMSGAIVNRLLSEAKQVLVHYAQENELSTDMATTFTVLVLSEGKAFVAWCGDSRVYHIRNGEILYRTTDHSLVNSLVKSGEITEEEALTHSKKNIILRAIRADDSLVEADYHFIEHVHDGDYFMLCTDGLLENIKDKNLRFLLTQNDKENIDLVEAFQQFCRGKTRDNYSMYLVKTGLHQNFAVYKRKIIALLAFLVLLISATVVIFSRYFEKKKHLKINPGLIQTVDSAGQLSTDTADHTITNSLRGITTKPADIIKEITPEKGIAVLQQMPAIKVAKQKTEDSSLNNKTLLRKQRNPPNIIFIDNTISPTENKANQEYPALIIPPKDSGIKAEQKIQPARDSL